MPGSSRILPRFSALLERHAGQFFSQSDLPRFHMWASEIPPALRASRPSLCMAAAWAAVATNHAAAAEEWLRTIERHFGHEANAALSDMSLAPGLRAALLEVLVLRLQAPRADLQSAGARVHTERIRAALDSLSPDQNCLFNTVMALKPVIAFDMGMVADVSDDADAAIRAYGEAVALSRLTHNTHIFHLALGHLANIQHQQGRLGAARQTHELALAQAASMGKAVSPYLALAHAGLGAIAYEHNDLAGAERHFHAALPLGRAWNQWEILVPTCLGLARLRYARSDTQLALSILDELQAPSASEVSLPADAYPRGCWQKRAGALPPSFGYAPVGFLPRATPPPRTKRFCSMSPGYWPRSTALMRRCRWPRISCAWPRRCGHAQVAIQSQVLLAKLYARQGSNAEAQTILSAAVRCAAPERYLRTFVDEGEAIRLLLGEIRAKDVRALGEPILKGFAPVETPSVTHVPAVGLPDALSEREQEVLRLVAQGFSNQEIANRLVISVTTVKTHVGNIFAKLGVASRTQAIARAEMMGLLPRR